MGCGMVRKLDELGRVVIPKEMRRILNIKTGSSIEMFIDENNHIVLKKFSEIENILFFAENLSEIIFNNLNLKCLICDDEKILVAKGVNKKEFLNKKIIVDNFNKNNTLTIKDIIYDTKEEFLNENDNLKVFEIISEGFNIGFVVIFCGKDKIEETLVEKISLLIKFFSSVVSN